ncbi:MAG TPA: cytochrome P450 [Terrimicrobiaceae bacterium]
MSLPDGPKTPATLQLIQWIASPLSFMRGCSDRYGDSFTINLGEKMSPAVVFSHPQALQTILTNDDSEEFDAPGDRNVIFEPLLGTQSVFGLSGDRHRRMRQLMMPPFHGERMRSYARLITDITDEGMRKCVTGESISLRKCMQAISLRVILKAVFGFNEGFRYEQMEQLLVRLLDEMSNPLRVSLLYFPALRRDLGPLSPWGNFVRKRERIDRLIYDEIAQRRARPNPSRNDILTLLMSARDEAGEALTDVELRDELMTLLVAGHETTATALTWALYWIHKVPKVRERLLAELPAADSTDSAAPSRLPYLNAVCCETLRIYPVGMLTFPRVTTSTVELMGHRLEPGTVVVGSIYLAHHRKEIYPDPDLFKPERFLERRFSPFEYLPFGGGARRCIGMAFAQMEMKLVISRILSNFELALADKRSVRPVRRGLTTGPSPVRLVVKNGSRLQ